MFDIFQPIKTYVVIGENKNDNTAYQSSWTGKKSGMKAHANTLFDKHPAVEKVLFKEWAAMPPVKTFHRKDWSAGTFFLVL